MKLKADTINGVTKVDCEIDACAFNVLDVLDFYYALPKLKDGEEIYCETYNDAMIAKISKEYGIRD